MSDFAAAIATMRDALKRAADAPNCHGPRHEAQPDGPPHSPAATAPSRELCAQFARELEAVGGKAIWAASIQAANESVLELARALKIKSAAIGDGVGTDLRPLSEALRADGIAVFGVAQVPEQRRAETRAHLAACDAGIVEADYAVAQSGTLVLVPTPARPRSLSLLPPINIALLRAERVVPNLAALMAALGPPTVADNPVVFITGPSRTADIEKRIVKGVHGPRALYAVLIEAAQG